MTDTQLYLAIGVPSLLALINIGVMLTLFLHLGTRIQSLEDRFNRFEERFDLLVGAIHDLDKRITRIEIKLGIQP